jgi:nitrous oxide reductase accessory protein NosL
MPFSENRRSFLIALLALPLAACSRKPDLSPREVRWDVQPCDECGMAMSDRRNGAQLIDPDSGKAYFFDDFGCAALWLDEKKPAWESRAAFYVIDAKSGKWIDARKAVYASPFMTPMSYGFSAFAKKEDVPQGKKSVSFHEALAAIPASIKQRENGTPASSAMPMRMSH